MTPPLSIMTQLYPFKLRSLRKQTQSNFISLQWRPSYTLLNRGEIQEIEGKPSLTNQGNERPVKLREKCKNSDNSLKTAVW